MADLDRSAKKMTAPHSSLSGSVRFFAFYLANRTLCLPILAGVDYRRIFEEPSALEQVFAIFMNCVVIDEEGRVTSDVHASERAAQYIRSYVDSSYRVEPPFEQHEVALHL